MRTVPATHDLVPAFLARIEPVRRQRLEDTLGNGPGWLERSIDASDITWCGIDDLGPVNMGGILRLDGPAPGYIWQVITPDIRLHKRSYIEQSRAYVRQATGRFPKLTTIIEAEYGAALRHVRRNGGTISEPMMINGTLSCYCERILLCRT